MTARSNDPDVSPEAASATGGEIWGTWEELLLACAVSRHGTASWDSVAMEVQTRSPFAARLTPHSCRARFRLLHRRFTGGVGAAENGSGGGDGDPDAAFADGWVEELRKLRVTELRREVERYDLSIGSLQTKVKRLKEEREKSFSETAPAVKEDGKDSPEEFVGEDRVSGEESGRSCKESNSSDLKRPGQRGDGAAAASDPAVKEEAAAGEAAVKEASGESVAESKEAEAEKESSDVQSSVSLSRRRRRKASSAGEEAEGEDAASVTLSAAESEPLIGLLESIRTSKSGSVFDRRLESLESAKYRSTIRRHVDLEMIKFKLDGPSSLGGGYSSASEFYRDLFLLCSNAVVFFPRSSPEYTAGTQIRSLVSKHISATSNKHHQPAAAASAPVPPVASKKPKTDSDIAGSLLEKTAPIIVCRKRSSITKAAAAAKEEKAEKSEAEKEKESEDKKKAATKDKARGLRTSKSRGTVRNSASNATPNQKSSKVTESSSATEGMKKSDKKSGSAAATGGVAKKRNAVDFLNRMNQNSSPSTERVSLLETLKLSAVSEQKKPGKGDGRKDSGGSGSKKAADMTPAKRSVGRPPKRAAAPPTPPPSKRTKEDTVGKPSSSTRKRGKK